jgi:hypothetical protein
MRSKRAYGVGLLVLLTVTLGGLSTAAYGQNNVAGRTALQNAQNGPVQGRAPGNMVAAGIAQAQMAADFAKTPIPITETSRPTPPRVTFLVEAIDIVLEQLNQAIALIANLLAVRSGGEELALDNLVSGLLPDEVSTPATGTSEEPIDGRSPTTGGRK